MSADDKPCQATPSVDLRQQILDSRVPKNEREWWASRTIEKLETERDQLRAEVARLSEWQAGVIKNARAHHAQLKEAIARAESAEADLAAAKSLLNEETDCAEAVEAAIVRQYARAERAEASLHAMRLVCGTTDADKFTTWVDRANARAEKAEAELATERARVRKVVIAACREAEIKPMVWYPKGSSMDPNDLGKINAHQVEACVASIDAAMKEGAK